MKSWLGRISVTNSARNKVRGRCRSRHKTYEAVQLRKRKMVQDLNKVHIDRHEAIEVEVIIETPVLLLRTVTITMAQTAMLAELPYRGCAMRASLTRPAAEGLGVLLADVPKGEAKLRHRIKIGK